ncbi:MAG: hypothetical protein HPY69_07895 [Armatimonadetes bacterium]|nr:hypothetical protein [Armatimonadota bacterium]
MRATAFYAPSSKDAPPEARGEVEKLLTRGGFLGRLASGSMLLPLGCRVLCRMLSIFRAEMVSAGALEVVFPGLVPLETWEAFAATIADRPGEVVARDSRQRDLVVYPRYGSLLAVVVGCGITSYRDLPRRFFGVGPVVSSGGGSAPEGVHRGESPWLDVCTMDATRRGQEQSVSDVCVGIHRALVKLGLDAASLYVTEVSAQETTQRRILTPSADGRQVVLHCSRCGHTASPHDCVVRAPETPPASAAQPALQLVETPGARTVQAVCAQLATTPDTLVKTLIYRCDDTFVAALVRGDRQLSETKLRRALGAASLRLAVPDEIRDLTGAEVGFSGPLGLPKDVAVIADHEVAGMHDCVLGANRTDMHLVHAAVGRDFVPDEVMDLRLAGEGDLCPVCAESALDAVVTAELARAEMFPPATATALDVNYADTEGLSRPVLLGLCSVDLVGCICAVVEQHHDSGGIAWPRQVAPFEVAILLLDKQSPSQVSAAEGLYGQLREAGRDVLLDDRDIRPGTKFYQADLVGYPVVIVVGKRLAQDGVVEVRRRSGGLEATATLSDVVSVVSEFLSG